MRVLYFFFFLIFFFFFFQAEDGIRDAQESRGLGDVYKRQTRDGKPATTLGVIHTITYRTLPETWFYKITGDTDAVMKERDAFRDYVRSARYPVMFKFPFVGGYLLGITLLVNLLAAHFQRFKFSRKKIGIFMTHAGLIFMLLGQLVTDKFQVESNLRLEEGQTKG